MSVLTLGAGAESLTGSKDPKLGIIALRLKCRADDLLTAITGALPAFGVNGLVESQPRTWKRSEAGDHAGYDVECTLEGHLAPDSADGVEYSLEGTTSEDAIETHPDYAALLSIYGGEEDDNGKGKWPKELREGAEIDVSLAGFSTVDLADTGGAAPRNPMHGVDSYLVPGLTWTRKSARPTLPADLIDSLGTIDDPPGDPPQFSGARNWLKIRVRATFRGNIWQIEETWLLSGPAGWVLEMYRR